jgi:hypothetical protein
MIRTARWLWKTGILSTFLAGLFAVLPIVITVGIMAWVGGVLKAWLGPESFVGKALFQMGLRFVTDPIVASVLGWVAVLLAIWFLGALLKWVGKKRIEKAFGAAVERIPLVNVLYRPVAQVVEMLQRDPTDKMQGMSVVYCAFRTAREVPDSWGCSSPISSTASTARPARSSTCRPRRCRCPEPSSSPLPTPFTEWTCRSTT